MPASSSSPLGQRRLGFPGFDASKAQHAPKQRGIDRIDGPILRLAEFKELAISSEICQQGYCDISLS